MPTGPEGEKRPADVTFNVVNVMRITTGGIQEGAQADNGKDPAGYGGRGIGSVMVAARFG